MGHAIGSPSGVGLSRSLSVWASSIRRGSISSIRSGGHPRRRARDRQGRDHVAAGAADGRGDRRESELELVDRSGKAALAHVVELGLQLPTVGDRQLGHRLQRVVGQPCRAEREKHLADRGAVVADRVADPLAGTEEVGRIDLDEVLDAGVARHREVDRLAGLVAERVQRGAGELDQVALQQASLGGAQDRRAGAQPSARAVLLDQSATFERRQPAAMRSTSGSRSPSPARSAPSAPATRARGRAVRRRGRSPRCRSHD